MSDEPYRTRSGRPLTETEIQDLAAEAERGYDVDELLARRDAPVAAPEEPRTWQMHGLGSSREVWYAVGDERFVRMHGGEPRPVAVVEDPGGDYLGWIEEGSDGPVMIQHRRIYEVQFPYGSRAEEERGRGRTVRLRIEEVA